MDNEEIKYIIKAFHAIANELEANPEKADQLISGKRFRKFIYYHDYSMYKLEALPDPDEPPKIKCLEITYL